MPTCELSAPDSSRSGSLAGLVCIADLYSFYPSVYHNIDETGSLARPEHLDTAQTRSSALRSDVHWELVHAALDEVSVIVESQGRDGPRIARCLKDVTWHRAIRTNGGLDAAKFWSLGTSV